MQLTACLLCLPRFLLWLTCPSRKVVLLTVLYLLVFVTVYFSSRREGYSLPGWARAHSCMEPSSMYSAHLPHLLGLLPPSEHHHMHHIIIISSLSHLCLCLEFSFSGRRACHTPLISSPSLHFPTMEHHGLIKPEACLPWRRCSTGVLSVLGHMMCAQQPLTWY